MEHPSFRTNFTRRSFLAAMAALLPVTRAVVAARSTSDAAPLIPPGLDTAASTFPGRRVHPALDSMLNEAAWRGVVQVQVEERSCNDDLTVKFRMPDHRPNAWCKGPKTVAAAGGSIIASVKARAGGTRDGNPSQDGTTLLRPFAFRSSKGEDFLIHASVFESAVFRLAPHADLRLVKVSAPLPTLGELGMDARGQDVLTRAINRPGGGLILVTGMAGSGRSTTVAALSQLVTVPVPPPHRISLERLVKRPWPGVIQKEVGILPEGYLAKAFADAALQAPTHLFVDEVSNPETLAGVFQAARLGIKVVAVTRATDVPTLLLSLEFWGGDYCFGAGETYGGHPVSTMLADTLSAAVTQKIVSFACPHCQVGFQPYLVSSHCAHCRHTGQTSTRAEFEVVEATPSMRAAIRERDSARYSKLVYEQRSIPA